MPSNYQIQKVNKKQRRCCKIISNECSIVSSEVPTQFLAILNAGLSTGLTDERVLAEASKYGAVQQLHMLPGKSYCFIIAGTVLAATQIYEGMHNKAALGQNDAQVYLAYFEQVPPFENPWLRRAPNGLIVLEDFITSEEEMTLLQAIAKPLESATDADNLKHRQVAHFGFEFLYGINNVDVNAPLEQQIPSACDALWPRLKQTLDDKGLQAEWSVPDQLTVNVYQPGQGIPPHVDTHSAFGDAIMSLSLESDVVMEFRKGSERAFMRLPRRSLLIMCGEARYAWTHGIAPRMLDIVPTTTTTLASALTTQRRCKRTSFTFRKLRRGSCDCAFPTLCDTRLNVNTHNKTTTTAAVAAQLETLNVHSVYDKIADHFSETRHKQWPQVAEFVNSFDCGAVLMDVGCGNGKYLTANSDMLKIGCDRSVGLLSLCASNKQSVFKCDCLQLPVRSASMDGCISIAVIHHLSTPERRLSAIREMARILVPGGRALIYVWAKNQQANDKKSSYLRQNKAVNKQKITEDEQRQFTAELQPSEESIFDLPIHTNRTQFQQQDMLVPWKLKNPHGDSSTYLRYYHVFENEELERLVSQIPEVDTVRSYYDQGNYCIIFKRKN